MGTEETERDIEAPGRPPEDGEGGRILDPDWAYWELQQ